MRSIRRAMAATVILIAIVAGKACRAEDAASPQAAPASPASPQGDRNLEQNPKRPELVPPTNPHPPPSVTVIKAVDAHGILGRDVRSPADENMGRIVDVIVDRTGRTRAAVIDFGGFLGVGSRKIVVDWSALHFWNVANKSESIMLELTRDQVKAAPEYKEDQPIVVLGASGSLEPLRPPAPEH